MRWIRYSTARGISFGILDADGSIREIDGSPFGDYSLTGHSLRLEDIRIEIPVVPPTFYAVGLNYPEHAKHYARAGADTEGPTLPSFNCRGPNSLLAHGDDIVVPSDSPDDVHYEGELVVVIGRKAKNLQPQDVASAIFGYTIGNDFSQRSWQREDASLWRAKNTDTFSPMGPWIESELDLDAAETIVRINGAESIRFRTNDMISGVETCLCALSRYVTLYPGDVLWMGTEGTSPDLRHGDVVDIEITGIGTLSNRVIFEGS